MSSKLPRWAITSLQICKDWKPHDQPSFCRYFLDVGRVHFLFFVLVTYPYKQNIKNQNKRRKSKWSSQNGDEIKVAT